MILFKNEEIRKPKEDKKSDLASAALFLDSPVSHKNTTKNQTAISSNSQVWLDLGNGKEELVKPNPKSPKNPKSAKPNPSKGKLVKNIKHTLYSPGDFIYYNEKWIKIESVKENTCFIKINGNLTEIKLSECIKEILINVMVCSSNRTYLYGMLVNGRKTFKQLGTKLAKHNNLLLSKADWYFNGKKIHNETRVEGISIKPSEKILCMIQEYEMRTFRRFKKIEDTENWHMSKEKADAITIIPTQPISLFGFGMFHCIEGPLAYLMSYQIFLYDSLVKSDSVMVTRVGTEQILQIFFSQSKEPIFVEAGMKFSIVIQYFDYEDASKLYKGTGGSDYDSIEGNEPGLFKILKHDLSGNGTDVNSGQIPELYYSKVG